MTSGAEHDCQFFASYTGVKLPLRLVNAIDSNQLSYRNTFICGYFDANGTLAGFDKMVYGEIELTHRYSYHANGKLSRAEIVMLDEDPVMLRFDENGAQTAAPDKENGS